MIKRVRGKYAVLSETTNRSSGSYRTLAEAQRRLRQVEFFKHLSKSKRRAKNPALQKTLRKKSLEK